MIFSCLTSVVSASHSKLDIRTFVKTGLVFSEFLYIYHIRFVDPCICTHHIFIF